MKQASNSPKKALFGTFLLAAIPSYLSHFIFSTGYAITLYFPALYALEKIKEDRKWGYITVIATSGAFLVQPIASGIFAIFIFIYWLVHALMEKSVKKEIIYPVIGGLLLSQLYWIPTFIKFGLKNFANKLGFAIFIGSGSKNSGEALHTLTDYIFSPLVNKMDQATGFGWMICILIILSVFIFVYHYKKVIKNNEKWIIISFFWLGVAFMMSISNYFPYKFVPSRSWAYMSIALVIFCAYGYFAIIGSFKNKTTTFFITIIVVLLVLLSSFYPKYVVQTSMWPPGPEFTAMQEVEGYVWMKENIPAGTPVMVLCEPNRDQKAASFNMRSLGWHKDVREFKLRLENHSAETIYNFAKSKGYKYVTLDVGCVSYEVLSLNQTQALLNDLQRFSNFEFTHSTSAMQLFRIR